MRVGPFKLSWYRDLAINKHHADIKPLPYIAFVGDSREQLPFMMSPQRPNVPIAFISDPNDLPESYSFFEYGHYGRNPAWLLMRDNCGFTTTERIVMHDSMKKFIKSQCDLSKCRMVNFHMNHIDHYAIDEMGFPKAIRFSPDALTEIATTMHHIELDYVVDEHSVVLGKFGYCKDCGIGYYSLKYPADDITEDQVDGVLQQIATESPYGIADVRHIYRESNHSITNTMNYIQASLLYAYDPVEYARRMSLYDSVDAIKHLNKELNSCTKAIKRLFKTHMKGDWK